MSTPAATPTPPAELTPEPASIPTPPEPDDTPPGAEASDRERRRWAALSGRVTQSIRERDEARALADRVRWREVERLAGATLAAPQDIRLEAPELADFLDPESGDVDPARVAAIAAELVAARPGLAPNAPRPLPGHGLPVPEAKPTFAQVLQEMGRQRGLNE